MENKETGRRVTGRISNKMITKNYKKKNGLKLKGDNTMKKNFKRVSAIILAADLVVCRDIQTKTSGVGEMSDLIVFVRENALEAE